MSFEEDEPGAAKERAARLLIARLKREQIVDLLQARRPNGELLSDVAIAVRVGCLPSEVAKVRAEEAGRETMGIPNWAKNVRRPENATAYVVATTLDGRIVARTFLNIENAEEDTRYRVGTEFDEAIVFNEKAEPVLHLKQR